MSENNSFWEKIKNDFGYDIFSAKNTENIAKELSDISVLFGNNEKYNFLKGEQNGSMDKWNQMDYEKIKKFIEENKIDDFIKENKDEKSLIEDFENLKNYSELKISSSKTITEIGNFVEKGINYIAKHITGNEKTLDNASKNYDIVNESDKLFNPNDGKYFKKAKIIKQKIINQNLSTFNGEEKAPKTVKINGTEFSPQEIAEAMGGGKSLNEFIKDNPFKQQQTEEKKEGEEKVNSNLENQANELRKNLSAGLELLNKYTALSNEYLEANNEKENEKLNNLLAFCKKGGKEEGNELDIKYFEKYDKSRNYNAGENFFADLENLKELEQKIQQEKERQKREKQEKERQQLLNQAKVNTYNKLYNGVEGKETNPAKSFDGTDFRDDKNDIVNLNDSNTSFNNINNPVNAVKNYVVNNIKEAKNLEKLNKQKDEIEATITLCSNQKTLGENKKSFDSKFNEVQEKLDKTKQTVQNNFNNFNSSINEKSKEEVDDIEVKTSTDAQAKIEELNRKKEELIKKVKQEKEAFDKNVEGTKSNNIEKKEKIENDIGNIGKDFDKTNITKDSINELASEIKNVSNSIDPNSLSSDVKTPDFNKDLEEIQKLNKQIENLGKTKDDLKKQEDLNQAKVNAYNKLYNGVEGKETNLAKSFNGENFYKDETNMEQTKIEDAELGLKNEKLNQYNNKVKDFTIQLEGNIKNSKDLESLEKNKESIGIMGELSNNAKQLNEEEHKIKGDYDKAQESLDNIKKKVQKNLLLLDEYSQNTSKEFNITQEEIEEDIEGKTIEDIEKELEELKKEKEKKINKFIEDCEKTAKVIDINKKENDEKIAEIRNDINNIDDSDINSFNEETKKKIDKFKDKNFFKGTEDIKIKSFEDYGLEDIDREIARLEKQKELVQERDKAVAPKESTPKDPIVESEAAKAAKILNEKGFGRFASNGKEFTENDMTPENFEISIRPILEEFNESFKNGVANSKNPMYKIYKDSTRLFDDDLLKNGHINIERENNTISKITIKYPKNHPFYSEYPEGKFEIENKDILSSEQIGHISMYTNENVKNRPLEYVRGVVELGEYIKNNVKQKEKSKENTTDRDISITPESNEPKQSIVLDDDLNQAKVEARNDLVRRINSTAEIATNFHNGEFYKGDEIKDENKLSTDKSNVGINNTDNAINCIIEQNVENIVKSKNKKEVEELKKNNVNIGELYNKTVELKEGKDDFNKRYTEAQENLKQISDTVDKNLESFNEFCDNSKKEVENSTKEINETENDIIKTEAEANKRIEELEEERKRLIEEFNEASEKSKEEIEEKQSSNDRIKEGTEMYVKSIGDGVSKENSLQENLESLKKDNIDEKIEMTKAEFSKDQEIPNFEDYKNRINEIDQHLAGLEKIKENLRQQEQENQEIDQPELEPGEIQQPKSETDINSLRLKFFNEFNKLVDKNAEEATLVKISDDEKSISYANESENIGLKEIEGKNKLKKFAENINDLMKKDKFLFENNEKCKYTQKEVEKSLINAKTILKSKEEAEATESNFYKVKDEVEGYKKRFDEKFEDMYEKIVKADINENIYDDLNSPEEIDKQKEELAKQKEELEKRYNEYKAKINEKSKEINEKETNLKKNAEDIGDCIDPESVNPFSYSEDTQELNELLKNFKKTSEVEGLNTEELKKFEADIAEIKAKEEVLSKVEEKINQKQQNTTELNLDDEVKAIANTKENNKDELIDNNIKLEDKCEQIYKQKGIENDKEKKYDVKCEELQKSINKLSDDQKKQYSERMEELIGYSLDMSVDKEKREKIDIDLCEKQRLYITKTKNCDGKVADNIKDAGVGVKVTDLSENYRRTVGQKSVGLVATVEDIDPKEFYKDGGVPKDVNVDKFNFARFTVQSIAEDKDDNYKGYKIDLKLPKDNNTVDIMADIRELGFEKAMEKYKDAGLEVNVRDSKGELLDKNEQKEFFEKLQPKDAEKSVGLEEQKQKMNDESLSKEEREKAEKKYNKIMSNDDSGIKPTIQADKEDPLPEVQQGSLSQTLPTGSNFRVPKSDSSSKNNNPKQQNEGQNMPEENKKKPNINPEVKKVVDDNCPGLNETQAKNLKPETPLPISPPAISAGQGQGQGKNQNISNGPK